MRIVRVLGVGLGLLALLTLGSLVAVWAPDRSAEDLATRWAGPPSEFVWVDGMKVHLRDEGPRDDPQPILLLHGTSSSLHTWDGWANVLKE